MLGRSFAALARTFGRHTRTILVFMPTWLALIYFGVIASDRYVSETQFVIRTAAKPVGGSGLSALMQMTGLGRAQDEVFSVQSFIGSRNAMRQLAERLPLREIYSRPEADFIARFPSFIYGDTFEEMYNFLAWMLTTTYNSTTGITSLKVQAFRPEDARNVAMALLELGEQTVNQLNARIHADAVRTAQHEVKRGEDRLVEAQIALTQFRNAETMIDPANSSVIVTELVARLGAELAQTEAQIREIKAAATNNPQLPALTRRAEAIQGQIARERARISNEGEGLATKLAGYERLVMDREFAKQTLTAVVKNLESAEHEVRRQQLYLQRVVEPIATDRAAAPERLRMIASTFIVNLILALVGWLVFSGLTEHARAD